MNASVLAVSTSASSHRTWCEHLAQVSIWKPQRTQTLNVQWTEVHTIPIKACVQALQVNPFNRDMFAAGTVTGDFYIWRYLYNEPNPIEELFADSSQYGGIVGIEFQSLPVPQDYSCLTCHNDGFIIQWKIAKIVIKDKVMRAFNVTKNESLSPTAICSINSTDFVVGTVDGRLLRCSTLHTKNLDTHLDPVNETFGKQTFSITKLQLLNEFLASCNASSEVHFYNLKTNSLHSVVKMPLPLNQRIACFNLEYILAACLNGELLSLKVDGKEQEIIENNLRGNGSLIEFSRNRKWIITGAYDSKFQIFEAEMDE